MRNTHNGTKLRAQNSKKSPKSQYREPPIRTVASHKVQRSLATALLYFSETAGTGALKIGGKKSMEFITHFIIRVRGLESKSGVVWNCSLWRTTSCFWNIPLVSSHVACSAQGRVVPSWSIDRSITAFTRRHEKLPSMFSSEAAF